MMTTYRGRRAADGFSLVELITVIGLLGLLASLLLPAVQRVRGAAARAACQDRMRQIGLALQNYHALHGRLPPLTNPLPRTSDPNRILGWMVLILPQVDQSALYQTSVAACATDTMPVHNPPHVGFATPIPTYVCPEDARLLRPIADRWGFTAAYASYIGVAGAVLTDPDGVTVLLPGVLAGSPGINLAQVTDGTSQTVMVGERPPPETLDAGWWYPIFGGSGIGPRGPDNWMMVGELFPFGERSCVRDGHGFGPGSLDNPCDRYHFWSLHSGGANWLFADGSVRFLSYSAEPIVFALASRAGGEAVTVPD